VVAQVLVELQPSAVRRERVTLQQETVQIRQALPEEKRQRMEVRRLASQSQRLKPSLEGKRKTALEQWQAGRGQRLRQVLEPRREEKSQTALALRQVVESQRLKQVLEREQEKKSQTAPVPRQVAQSQRLKPALERQREKKTRTVMEPLQAGFAQREPAPRRTSALLQVLELEEPPQTWAANFALAAAVDWVAPTGGQGLRPDWDCQKRQVPQVPMTCW
jgi:hypothetical protein